jgi:hypothetical protein
MAKYEEASVDYAELERLAGELGIELSAEQTQLKGDIEQGMKAGEGSERRRKDELMRAIDVCVDLLCDLPLDSYFIVGSRICAAASVP